MKADIVCILLALLFVRNSRNVVTPKNENQASLGSDVKWCKTLNAQILVSV